MFTEHRRASPAGQDVVAPDPVDAVHAPAPRPLIGRAAGGLVVRVCVGATQHLAQQEQQQQGAAGVTLQGKSQRCHLLGIAYRTALKVAHVVLSALQPQLVGNAPASLPATSSMAAAVASVR